MCELPGRGLGREDTAEGLRGQSPLDLVGRNNGLQLPGPQVQGLKSQGRVHLPPGPPPSAAASQELGPPNFLPRRPCNGLWRSQRGG